MLRLTAQTLADLVNNKFNCCGRIELQFLPWQHLVKIIESETLDGEVDVLGGKSPFLEVITDNSEEARPLNLRNAYLLLNPDALIVLAAAARGPMSASTMRTQYGMATYHAHKLVNKLFDAGLLKKVGRGIGGASQQPRTLYRTVPTKVAMCVRGGEVTIEILANSKTFSANYYLQGGRIIPETDGLVSQATVVAGTSQPHPAIL